MRPWLSVTTVTPRLPRDIEATCVTACLGAYAFGTAVGTTYITDVQGVPTRLLPPPSRSRSPIHKVLFGANGAMIAVCSRAWIALYTLRWQTNKGSALATSIAPARALPMASPGDHGTPEAAPSVLGQSRSCIGETLVATADLPQTVTEVCSACWELPEDGCIFNPGLDTSVVHAAVALRLVQRPRERKYPVGLVIATADGLVLRLRVGRISAAGGLVGNSPMLQQLASLPCGINQCRLCPPQAFFEANATPTGRSIVPMALSSAARASAVAIAKTSGTVYEVDTDDMACATQPSASTLAPDHADDDHEDDDKDKDDHAETETTAIPKLVDHDLIAAATGTATRGRGRGPCWARLTLADGTCCSLGDPVASPGDRSAVTCAVTMDDEGDVRDTVSLVQPSDVEQLLHASNDTQSRLFSVRRHLAQLITAHGAAWLDTTLQGIAPATPVLSVDAQTANHSRPASHASVHAQTRIRLSLGGDGESASGADAAPATDTTCLMSDNVSTHSLAVMPIEMCEKEPSASSGASWPSVRLLLESLSDASCLSAYASTVCNDEDVTLSGHDETTTSSPAAGTNETSTPKKSTASTAAPIGYGSAHKTLDGGGPHGSPSKSSTERTGPVSVSNMHLSHDELWAARARLVSLLDTEPSSAASLSTTTAEPSSAASLSTTTAEPSSAASLSTTTAESSSAASPSTTTAEPSSAASLSTTTAESSSAASHSTTTAESSSAASHSTTTAEPSSAASHSTTTAESSSAASLSTTGDLLAAASVWSRSAAAAWLTDNDAGSVVLGISRSTLMRGTESLSAPRGSVVIDTSDVAFWPTGGAAMHFLPHSGTERSASLITSSGRASALLTLIRTASARHGRGRHAGESIRRHDKHFAPTATKPDVYTKNGHVGGSTSGAGRASPRLSLLPISATLARVPSRLSQGTPPVAASATESTTPVHVPKSSSSSPVSPSTPSNQEYTMSSLQRRRTSAIDELRQWRVRRETSSSMTRQSRVSHRRATLQAERHVAESSLLNPEPQAAASEPQAAASEPQAAVGSHPDSADAHDDKDEDDDAGAAVTSLSQTSLSPSETDSTRDTPVPLLRSVSAPAEPLRNPRQASFPHASQAQTSSTQLRVLQAISPYAILHKARDCHARMEDAEAAVLSAERLAVKRLMDLLNCGPNEVSVPSAASDLIGFPVGRVAAIVAHASALPAAALLRHCAPGALGDTASLTSEARLATAVARHASAAAYARREMEQILHAAAELARRRRTDVGGRAAELARALSGGLFRGRADSSKTDWSTRDSVPTGQDADTDGIELDAGEDDSGPAGALDDAIEAHLGVEAEDGRITTASDMNDTSALDVAAQSIQRLVGRIGSAGRALRARTSSPTSPADGGTLMTSSSNSGAAVSPGNAAGGRGLFSLLSGVVRSVSASKEEAEGIEGVDIEAELAVAANTALVSLEAPCALELQRLVRVAITRDKRSGVLTDWALLAGTATSREVVGRQLLGWLCTACEDGKPTQEQPPIGLKMSGGTEGVLNGCLGKLAVPLSVCGSVGVTTAQALLDTARDTTMVNGRVFAGPECVEDLLTTVTAAVRDVVETHEASTPSEADIEAMAIGMLKAACRTASGTDGLFLCRAIFGSAAVVSPASEASNAIWAAASGDEDVSNHIAIDIAGPETDKTTAGMVSIRSLNKFDIFLQHQIESSRPGQRDTAHPSSPKPAADWRLSPWLRVCVHVEEAGSLITGARDRWVSLSVPNAQ